MIKEIWKDIEGYEGLYQISNLGNVKSLQRKFTGGKSLKCIHDKSGYLRCGLIKAGKHRVISIHRLVATAFIPNPDNKSQVNHIDGNKGNNCVTNLEWVTPSENAKHAFIIGLRTAVGRRKVLQFDLQGNFIREFKSLREAGRSVNAKSLGGILLCCQGKRNKAHGYIWKYKNERNK